MSNFSVLPSEDDVIFKGLLQQCSEEEIILQEKEMYIIASNFAETKYTCIQKFKAAEGAFSLNVTCEVLFLRLSCSHEHFVLQIDGRLHFFCGGSIAPRNKFGKKVSLHYYRKNKIAHGMFFCFVRAQATAPFVDDVFTLPPGLGDTWNVTVIDAIPEVLLPEGGVSFNVSEPDRLNNNSEGDIIFQVKPKEAISKSVEFFESQERCGVCGKPVIAAKNTGDDDNEWYPWCAVVTTKQPAGLTRCGGALISTDLVLTPAHCVDKSLGDIEVSLGKHSKLDENYLLNAVNLTGMLAILHPEYIGDLYNDNIALVRLSQSVSFNEEIRPVCLPTNNASYSWTSGKERGYFRTSKECKAIIDNAVSFPTTFPLQIANQKIGIEIPHLENGNFSDVMNLGDVTIWSNSYCRYVWSESKVLDQHLCAHRSDQIGCHGLLGSPIVVKEKGRWVIVGESAYWEPGCVRTKYPSLFTRISSYLPWITSHFTEPDCSE